MKRPDKIKLEIVAPPTTAHFVESLGRRGVSVYVQKLSEALQKGHVVRIAKADLYLRQQFKNAAKTVDPRA